LSEALRAHIPDVEEFKFVQELATQMGVRAWLFGGTAAGYAHYTKWDLQRQHGDTSFRTERFDYDYTNIYRSTQDADIVIDGTPEQAHALEMALSLRFDHLHGEKSLWEVRLMKKELRNLSHATSKPSG
jgi:hypothetical protein